MFVAEVLCVSSYSLDLDAWINDPPSESEDDEDEAYKKEIFVKHEGTSKHKKEKYEPTEEELQKVRFLERGKTLDIQYS